MGVVPPCLRLPFTPSTLVFHHACWVMADECVCGASHFFAGRKKSDVSDDEDEDQREATAGAGGKGRWGIAAKVGD